jgi:hypothetical protein
MLNAQTQTPPGIALYWNQVVGCQKGNDDPKRTIDFNDIEASECLRVCSFSTVDYELFYLPAGAITTWTVAGGTVTTSANDIISVQWGNIGVGSISIAIQLLESSISRTLCIEKMERPTALFNIASQTNEEVFETCSEQIINFINLSSPNNGSDLNSFHWDFGDGNYSNAFEPNHSYAVDGNYAVILSVYNKCNCIDKYQMEVIAQRKGLEITCPTVVCEGQTAVYSLPPNTQERCNGALNWSVIGGEILLQVNGNIQVLWNNVDESGFGYVTFNPENCDLECRAISTVKVPVIQSKGTIKGSSELCQGEQGLYKLPQWPTTDIQWEIVGNSGNTLATLLPTDQRNEIIVVPLVSGVLTLRAVYTNTLLKCSGQAAFRIIVADPLQLLGESSFCVNSSGIFSNTQNASVSYTLRNNLGSIVASTTAAQWTYTFGSVGTFTLSVDAPNFCSAADKTIVVLPLPPTPVVTGTLEVCPNAPYAYNVQTPDPNMIYTWVVSNGTVIGETTGAEVNISFTGTFPAVISVTSSSINPMA